MTVMRDTLPEPVTTLPPSVAQIAEVIGRSRALYLIGCIPPTGRRSWRVCFYVPKVTRPDHWLVALLGWHDAAKLTSHFGGEILHTSNCRFMVKRFRDAEIRRMRRAGMQIDEIAQAVGLSVGRVQDIAVQR